MSKYKYQNLNNFPVWLPGERGEQIMFRPNEATTRNWFSRFIGAGKLTRVPVDQQESMKQSIPTPMDIPAPVVTAILPKSPSFANKETEEYTVRDGLYTCKLCGTFVTGSSSSMTAHITSYHQKPTVVPKPVQIDEEERVVVSSRASVSAQANSDEANEEVTQTASGTPPVQPQISAPEKVTPPPPENEFACPHPGCGKAFTSNRGLQMHITRVHGRD